MAPLRTYLAFLASVSICSAVTVQEGAATLMFLSNPTAMSVNASGDTSELPPPKTVTASYWLAPAMAWQPKHPVPSTKEQDGGVFLSNMSAPNMSEPKKLLEPEDGVCGQELIEDTSYWPLVAILCLSLLTFAWDAVVYHFLGRVPPFSEPKPIAEDDGGASALPAEDPLLGIPYKSAEPAVDEAAADAAAKQDSVEDADFKSKIPLFTMIGFLSLAQDAGYALPISYLPCLLIAKGGSDFMAGTVVGCYGGGVMLGSVFAPFLLRKIPTVVVMRSTIIPLATSACIFGMATWLDDVNNIVIVMCIARFIFGLCVACNEVSGQALVYRMVSEDKITIANTAVQSVRTLGQLGSPVVGSLFYTIGGAPAPMIFSALLFLIMYFIFTLIIVPRLSEKLQPKAEPDQASVFQLLSVCPAAWVFISIMLAAFLMVGTEPILSPMLTGPPYNMNYLDVGGFALVGPVSSMIGMILLAGWLYKKIGIVPQLCIGWSLSAVGTLLFGPSSLVPLEPSIGLLVTSMIISGVGVAISIILTPLILMDILWHKARLTKRQLAGSLVATNSLFFMMVGLLAPMCSSALFEAGGNSVKYVSTASFGVAALLAPIIIIGINYNLSAAYPSFPACRKSTDDLQEAQADSLPSDKKPA